MLRHSSADQLYRALLLMTLLGACGRGISPDVTLPSTDVTLNVEFELAPAKTASVAGTDLAVRLDSVVADSRCPIGVACVWAGDADIHLSLVRGKRAPTPAVIHVTTSPKSVVNGAEIIEFVSLDPLSREQTPIKPSDYRVRLIVRTRS